MNSRNWYNFLFRRHILLLLFLVVLVIELAILQWFQKWCSSIFQHSLKPRKFKSNSIPSVKIYFLLYFFLLLTTENVYIRVVTKISKLSSFLCASASVRHTAGGVLHSSPRFPKQSWISFSEMAFSALVEIISTVSMSSYQSHFSGILNLENSQKSQWGMKRLYAAWQSCTTLRSAFC